RRAHHIARRAVGGRAVLPRPGRPELLVLGDDPAQGAAVGGARLRLVDHALPVAGDPAARPVHDAAVRRLQRRPQPQERHMTFSQKLPGSFYAGALARVRARMSAAGLAALLLDDPLDVAYLTGFHHFPNERPVACWLPLDGDPVLLVPDLEREYAEDQGARAE